MEIKGPRKVKEILKKKYKSEKLALSEIKHGTIVIEMKEY
jgi:hypothetical protein